MKVPLVAHMKDPSYTDEAGNFYPGDMEPIELEWSTDVEECDHRYTACVQCVEDWAHEYSGVIRVPGYAECTLEQVISFKYFVRWFTANQDILKNMLKGET